MAKRKSKVAPGQISLWDDGPAKSVKATQEKKEEESSNGRMGGSGINPGVLQVAPGDSGVVADCPETPMLSESTKSGSRMADPASSTAGGIGGIPVAENANLCIDRCDPESSPDVKKKTPRTEQKSLLPSLGSQDFFSAVNTADYTITLDVVEVAEPETEPEVKLLKFIDVINIHIDLKVNILITTGMKYPNWKVITRDEWKSYFCGYVKAWCLEGDDNWRYLSGEDSSMVISR